MRVSRRGAPPTRTEGPPLASPADSIPTSPRTSPARGALDAGDVQQVFQREYQQARDYIDGEVGPQRAQATNYYLGRPFGDEEQGRSQVISRDVRDTVLNYLPGIMRVLFGGERAVEYQPVTERDAPFAEQATDVVNLIVLRQDNDGFLEVYSAVKDALVRKVGFLKWWWDESVTLSGASYSGLDELALRTLSQDPEVESLQVTKDDRDPERVRYDATCTRRRRSGRVRIGAVAPEEILINRQARSFRDARAVFHRRSVLVNDLVAMGYGLEEILDHAEPATSLEGNQEALARTPAGVGFADAMQDDLLRRVLYVEGYLMLPVPGEDMAALHKVCCIGEKGQVLTLPDGTLAVERIDHIPFAALCPDPEPHAFFGTCPADMAMDIQRVKSAVQRGMLDSLALAIEPRVEVVEGQVNLHDLMNPEVNRIIRVRAPGQMREVGTPFLGQSCLPVLGYYDQVLQQRTKQNDASQGLDADALQSTTKAGVAATITAAQAQQELTARLFAEGGIRALFRGVLRLLCQHQDQPRTVRLRDQWVAVDPRQWNAEMDVIVNVALGAGSHDDRLAALREIAAKQEQILATQGITNPLATPAQYRYTLAKMVELAGFRDASQFFQRLPPNYQPPATPPAPDATQVMAQLQMAELNLKAQVEAEKLKLEREKALMDDATTRFKAMLAAQASIKQGEARAGMQWSQAQLDAAVQHMGQMAEQDTAKHIAHVQAQADTVQTAMGHGAQLMQQAQQPPAPPAAPEAM